MPVRGRERRTTDRLDIPARSGFWLILCKFRRKEEKKITVISMRLDGSYTGKERHRDAKITTRVGNKLTVQVLTDRSVGFMARMAKGKHMNSEVNWMNHVQG